MFGFVSSFLVVLKSRQITIMVRDYVMQWWNVISQLFTRNSRKSILLGQTIKDFAYAAIFLPIRCVAVKTLYYHSYLNIIFHEQRKIWKRKIDRKAIFEKNIFLRLHICLKHSHWSWQESSGISCLNVCLNICFNICLFRNFAYAAICCSSMYDAIFWML